MSLLKERPDTLEWRIGRDCSLIKRLQELLPHALSILPLKFRVAARRFVGARGVGFLQLPACHMRPADRGVDLHELTRACDGVARLSIDSAVFCWLYCRA